MPVTLPPWYDNSGDILGVSGLIISGLAAGCATRDSGHSGKSGAGGIRTFRRASAVMRSLLGTQDSLWECSAYEIPAVWERDAHETLPLKPGIQIQTLGS